MLQTDDIIDDIQLTVCAQREKDLLLHVFLRSVEHLWEGCGYSLSLIPAALADILQGLFQVLHNDHCKCESSKEMLRKIEGIQ